MARAARKTTGGKPQTRATQPGDEDTPGTQAYADRINEIKNRGRARDDEDLDDEDTPA